MKNLASKITFIALISSAVAGCQSTQERRAQDAIQKMNNQLDVWINQPVSNFALSKGNPKDIVKLSEDRTAFRWVFVQQSPAMIMPPVYGSMMVLPSQQLFCNISFIAKPTKKKPELKDFIITDYNWNGHC